MAIIQTDLLIKTMIEAAFNDLRANHWVLEHIFEGLATDPLARREYGYKEVESAKRWFLNTDIPVLLTNRIADKAPIPCIVIDYQSSAEAQDRTSLGDEGQISAIDPSIFVPDRSLSDKFTPLEYNSSTGQITTPKDALTWMAVPGQFLVASGSGKAYEIKKVIDKENFVIASDLCEDFTDSYIRSKFGCWNLHEEVTFMAESYELSLYTQGDFATCVWLWQIVVYSLLRYKEAFLEGRLFELSTFNSGPYRVASEFSADRVYARSITFSGVVPATFVKFAAPRIEAVESTVIIADGSSSPPGTYPTPVEQTRESWYVDGDFNNYTQEVQTDAPVDDDVLIPPTDSELPPAVIMPDDDRCDDE